MDVKARNQLAIAMLVFAKVFGIAGLILGATSYRFLGGALLVIDGVLLAFAAYLGIRNMNAEKVDEKDHKSVLEQMMREGTLDQYLRDIRAEAAPKKADAAPASSPPPATSRSNDYGAPLSIRTPATPAT